MRRSPAPGSTAYRAGSPPSSCCRPACRAVRASCRRRYLPHGRRSGILTDGRRVGRLPVRRPALARCEPIEPVNPILLTASAEQRASSPTGERTRRRQSVRRIAISSRVFVGNLSYETSREELETAFSRVGQVVDVVLPVD
ncbi:MAG: RNA-binding protein, partial [Acidobacteria bacterium]|nr:RNA-binding protein [Acidobacteriota bacterium]